MKSKKILIPVFLLAVLIAVYFFFVKSKGGNPNLDYKIGQIVDSLNDVYVYFNGDIENEGEKSLSSDKFNFGYKYSCNEFVNRYYYNVYKLKINGSSIEPKDYFDKEIPDGELNPKFNLLQFTNPSFSLPFIGDVLILDKNEEFPNGHLAIVSNIYDGAFEVIQQNAGPFSNTRALFGCGDYGNKYKVDNKRVLGWLRIKEDVSRETK